MNCIRYSLILIIYFFALQAQDAEEALYLLQNKTENGFIDISLVNKISAGLKLIRSKFPDTQETYCHQGFELNRLMVTICTDLEENTPALDIPEKVIELNKLFNATIQETVLNSSTGFFDIILEFDGCLDILTVKKQYENLRVEGVIRVKNVARTQSNYERLLANSVDIAIEYPMVKFIFHKEKKLPLLCYYHTETGELTAITEKSASERDTSYETTLLLPKEPNCCFCSIY